MFDFVQERKRFVQIVLLLIILPFAFFGVDSYNKSNQSAALATVNGSEVSAQEFENALRQQQDRMRQMLGANYDAAMFETPEIRKAVLDGLVGQKLLMANAKSAGLTVTDEQIAEVIGGVEVFQENGKFDKKRYQTVLSNKNMSPLMFEAQVRDDLLSQQLREVYIQNGFIANATTDNIIRLNEQQRVVSVATVSFQDFMAQTKVDEAAVKQYYTKNAKEFEVPEQAKVEYVKFSVANLMDKIDIPSADAQKYYDAHVKEFEMAEQRQAAHILISAAADAPQAVQDAAKAKAEQLLQQVKQNPASFAELAKANSQDPGSAMNGGDLGFFGKGQMVKPFEDTTFSLKTGEISGLVKSDFGYHIIKLVAIKPASVSTFAEVSAEIISKLREQKAADQFAELADKFNNTVYEQSDTLKPAAELVNGKIEQSDWLSAKMTPTGFWTSKMLQAVFSEDVLKNKRNSVATEVAPNTLVAARMLEHKPASVRPLAEVQAAIQQTLMRKQAIELAIKQGKAQLAELQKGGTPTVQWAEAKAVSRAQRSNFDAALTRQIFQVNQAKLPQTVGAETADGFTLVRVDAIKEAEKVEDGKRVRYAEQLRKMIGEEIYRAYMEDAKQHATIKSNLPATPAAKP
ncbi:MAG: SurA N-terminal domain-containing protein [Gallionella sp.]|nr:SurA N-terminal domain-containing protein [Gallionella sp.]